MPTGGSRPARAMDGAVKVDLSRMGRLAEVIQVNLPAGGRQASDVTTVAQTAAAKIDTVVGG